MMPLKFQRLLFHIIQRYCKPHLVKFLLHYLVWTVNNSVKIIGNKDFVICIETIMPTHTERSTFNVFAEI